MPYDRLLNERIYAGAAIGVSNLGAPRPDAQLPSQMGCRMSGMVKGQGLPRVTPVLNAPLRATAI